MEALLGTRGTTTDCPLAIIVRDGKLLTGLRHYTADKYKDISVWTLPGGRCDEGETLETTLRRELSEEVGITNFSIEKHLGSMPEQKTGDTVHLFFCKSGQNQFSKNQKSLANGVLQHPMKYLKTLCTKKYFSLSERPCSTKTPPYGGVLVEDTLCVSLYLILAIALARRAFFRFAVLRFNTPPYLAALSIA